MADKIIYKHKRKALIALLLLFFSRTKNTLVVLFVAGAVTTFVFSGGSVAKILKFPPFAALASLAGYGAGSSPSSVYSNDSLKNAFDKAAAESKSRYFWDKFSNKEFLDSPDKQSTLEMVGGGGVFKEAGGDEGSSDTGEVNSGESEKADVVDFQDKYAGKEKEYGEEGKYGEGGEYGVGGTRGSGGGYGAAQGSGLYGNVMGKNLAERSRGWGATSKGSYSKNAPYIGKGLKSGKGTATDKKDGLVKAALKKGHVPSVSKPGKIGKRSMGKLSGFSWKNKAFKTMANKKISKVGSGKRAMFQAAETFAMTSSAFMSKNSAKETQSSYSGSTYDGNDVNLEGLETGVGMMGLAEPDMPDFTFLVKILAGGEELMGLSKVCSDAIGNEGAEITRIQATIDSKLLNLGSSPDCCSRGAVYSWNAKLDVLKRLCRNFNSVYSVVASKCQSSYSPQNCNFYEPKKVRPCKWITVCGENSCWKVCLRRIFQAAVNLAMIVVGALLVAMTGGAAMAVGVGLMAAGVSGLAGLAIGGPIGAMLSTVGAVVAGFAGGPVAMLAMVAAVYISDKMADAYEDDSVGGDQGSKPDYDLDLDSSSGDEGGGDAPEGDSGGGETKPSTGEGYTGPSKIFEHEITFTSEEIASGRGYDALVREKLEGFGHTKEEIDAWFEASGNQEFPK